MSRDMSRCVRICSSGRFNVSAGFCSIKAGGQENISFPLSAHFCFNIHGFQCFPEKPAKECFKVNICTARARM